MPKVFLVWFALATMGLVSCQRHVTSPAHPSLDAPVETRPTLRSEIQRGWLAVNQCDTADTPLDRETCINKIQGAEDARLMNATPFDLGVSLNSWFTQDMDAEIYQKQQATNAFARAQ